VGIFAKRDIMEGEELTFDYQFERFGSKKQRCLCGAKNCCIWIGGKPKKLEAEERLVRFLLI
jgi:histone-lysine N-methyltransferase SETD2